MAACPTSDRSRSHTLRSPAHVEYGSGAVAELESFASDRDAETALLVADGNLVDTAKFAAAERGRDG